MQGVDERVFYRVRKTTQEMLRDRGYELPDGTVEEDFDTFKKRYDEGKHFNMLPMRPCKNQRAAMMVDQNEDDDEDVVIMEPILVVFHMDGTSLSNQAISAMVQKMVDWTENTKQKN